MWLYKVQMIFFLPLASCTVSSFVKVQTTFAGARLFLYTTQAAILYSIKPHVHLHTWLGLRLSQLIQCYVQVHLKRHCEQLPNSVAFLPHHPQMQQRVSSHWLVPTH